jgi:adenylate cyclase
MSAALKSERSALLGTVLAPLLPQVIGSIFNIWYNTVVVEPLFAAAALKARFTNTIIVCNLVVYPAAIAIWLSCVFSLRPALRTLLAGNVPPAEELTRARRRLIALPWSALGISGAAWFVCIPIFLGALATVGEPIDGRVFWHLPISFAVSGFIAMTHAFFLVEIATERRLFPLFFQGARPDQTPGARPLLLRGRGVLWAISASVCPLVSVVMISFAPRAQHEEYFELFVAVVGIGFSMYTALLINRLVAEPVDHLRVAVEGVAAGQLDANVPVRRADELGVLAAEVNRMIGELRTAQSMRQTFGLHVGRKVVERLLARDPALGGVQETVTVMFVDIRNFTGRSKGRSPHEVVAGLNEFLAVMVEIVEARYGGMINKFLGDGFMALFGAIEEGARAGEAVAASREMLAALTGLNARLAQRGEAPLAIGIGLHTGDAVIGSIGSRDRMEFTAIGSTVNLAARVEGMTKILGVPFLFTEPTCLELDGTSTKDLGEHPVRGMPEPVRLFTVTEG